MTKNYLFKTESHFTFNEIFEISNNIGNFYPVTTGFGTTGAKFAELSGSSSLPNLGDCNGIEFEEIKQEDVDKMSDLLHEKNGSALANLRSDDADKSLYWANIQKTFAKKGQIGKHGKMVEDWIAEAIEYVQGVAVTIQDNAMDESIVLEAYNELNEHEVKLFKDQLEPEQQINIENILHTFQNHQ